MQDQADYILHVKALDLPKMDVMGKCYPYLVFQICHQPEKFKTKYIDQTYEPVWNEEFHIHIGKINPNDFLHVELYDYDRIVADELISTYDFYLDSLAPENSQLLTQPGNFIQQENCLKVALSI